jgi:hypothetical protein
LAFLPTPFRVVRAMEDSLALAERARGLIPRRLRRVYQDRPDTEGLGVLNGPSGHPSPFTTDAADGDVRDGTIPAGFLNRVRKFDSCRGH